MSKGRISDKDIKLLWGRSGSVCAMCKAVLITQGDNYKYYLIGEMAHIEGENPSSARHDSNMESHERNCYENLLILCPNCHTTIDKNPETYPVEMLTEIKFEHEEWVLKTLKESVLAINFPELEVICKYLLEAPMERDNDISTLYIEDKIKKNKLSAHTQKLITIGLLQTKLVGEYLNRNPDIHFADRLKAGFVKKYVELKNLGYENDLIFEEMVSFTCNNSDDFERRGAGLSVLTYFFEACEVFEK